MLNKAISDSYTGTDKEKRTEKAQIEAKKAFLIR